MIRVALRKESVDRNYPPAEPFKIGEKSLSARRAWIEILYQLYDTYAKVSLSARRAWIEIDWARSLFRYLGSRSPQGERG